MERGLGWTTPMQMNTVKLATCDWLILSRRRGSTPAVTGSAIHMLWVSHCSFASAWPHPVPVPSIHTPVRYLCCAWMHTQPDQLNAWLRAESASSTKHKLNQTFFFSFFGAFIYKPLFKTIMTILWNTQNDWITSHYASHSHTNGSSAHSFAQCTTGRRKQVDTLDCLLLTELWTYA